MFCVGECNIAHFSHTTLHTQTLKHSNTTRWLQESTISPPCWSNPHVTMAAEADTNIPTREHDSLANLLPCLEARHISPCVLSTLQRSRKSRKHDDLCATYLRRMVADRGLDRCAHAVLKYAVDNSYDPRYLPVARQYTQLEQDKEAAEQAAGIPAMEAALSAAFETHGSREVETLSNIVDAADEAVRVSLNYDARMEAIKTLAVEAWKAAEAGTDAATATAAIAIAELAHMEDLFLASSASRGGASACVGYLRQLVAKRGVWYCRRWVLEVTACCGDDLGEGRYTEVSRRYEQFKRAKDEADQMAGVPHAMTELRRWKAMASTPRAMDELLRRWTAVSSPTEHTTSLVARYTSMLHDAEVQARLISDYYRQLRVLYKLAVETWSKWESVDAAPEAITTNKAVDKATDKSNDNTALRYV